MHTPTTGPWVVGNPLIKTPPPPTGLFACLSEGPPRGDGSHRACVAHQRSGLRAASPSVGSLPPPRATEAHDAAAQRNPSPFRLGGGGGRRGEGCCVLRADAPAGARTDDRKAVTPPTHDRPCDRASASQRARHQLWCLLVADPFGPHDGRGHVGWLGKQRGRRRLRVETGGLDGPRCCCGGCLAAAFTLEELHSHPRAGTSVWLADKRRIVTFCPSGRVAAARLAHVQ